MVSEEQIQAAAKAMETLCQRQQRMGAIARAALKEASDERA